MNNERFAEVYTEYFRTVHKVIAYIVRDFHVAEDLTQDCFLALHRHAHRIDLSKLKYWLIRTGKNLAINYLQRSKRTVLVAADVLDGMGVEPCPCSALEKRQSAAHLHEGIRALPEHLNTVTVQHYMEGIPQIQVAVNLSVPLGTVKSRLNKARQLLRSHVEHFNQ